MLKEKGLYRDTFEHDACGIGFIVQIDGEASPSISSRWHKNARKHGASRETGNRFLIPGERSRNSHSNPCSYSKSACRY